MGTYYIPRNVKGETRLLYIFSIKSLITTAVGGVIGFIIFSIMSAVGLKIPGIVIGILFALIGFGIGAIKIPSIGGLQLIKKVGGEELSDVILRYIKFKKNKKVYVYTKTEEKDNEEEK